MDSNSSDRRYVSAGARSVKVLVLGPFAVGKTTLVASVSEIRPMHTEERMTVAGELVDDLGGLTGKDTTTVAMDFGRVTLARDIVLYLFGAPGQPRFHRMVRSLMEGALGGLVLVDTRRLDQSFDAIDLLESAGLPYTVAVNHFPGAPRYSDAEIRDSLTMAEDRPLVWLDARYRHSAKEGLIALVTDILARPRLEPAR
ncbi:ATP/GTP-binding protein [Streptomyces pactum]|uniref:ATP/GTP-binding protein n=1 Tax=Streptomyces pactum TaxID=68249 RepID=A0ABS0NEM5_9ACTN|nr:ATP/GTP-binding protein [Streptomyces pactum]MBH5333645.1 ATP/GTP-binding protein [Streptomyces pactum]